jgi:hypothetical protein
LVDFRAKIHCAIVVIPSVKQWGQFDIVENRIFKYFLSAKLYEILVRIILAIELGIYHLKKSINYADNDMQIRLETYFGIVYTLSNQLEFTSTTHRPSALSGTLCYQTGYIFF